MSDRQKNASRAKMTGGYINISCLFVLAAFMKINCIRILCAQRYNNVRSFWRACSRARYPLYIGKKYYDNLERHDNMFFFSFQPRIFFGDLMYFTLCNSEVQTFYMPILLIIISRISSNIAHEYPEYSLRIHYYSLSL